jgi:hypothetical protein
MAAKGGAAKSRTAVGVELGARLHVTLSMLAVRCVPGDAGAMTRVR